MLIHLIVRLIIKRYGYIKWVIFLNHIPIVKTKKVKSDLSNYATQSDLNSAIGIDSSEFAEKVNLASLK